MFPAEEPIVYQLMVKTAVKLSNELNETIESSEPTREK